MFEVLFVFAGFSMPPPEMGQVVSPQSDGMPRLFPDGMQQMPMANSPQYPAAMPQPQPQQMGAVGLHDATHALLRTAGTEV